MLQIREGKMVWVIVSSLLVSAATSVEAEWEGEEARSLPLREGAGAVAYP